MVAAFWGDHPNHEASLKIFAEANPHIGSCGIHSLAEVYAVMTALPVRPILAPAQVFLFVEQITERLAVVALDPDEYLEVARGLSEKGLASGSIYDALLLACARKSGAKEIYTWNGKHFRQIAPDLTNRIRTP